MAIYKQDIVDVDLDKTFIHRGKLGRSIGKGDDEADHFGVRVFRNGEPVDLTDVSVAGYFYDAMGNETTITTGNIVSGNTAAVVLPDDCYENAGKFTLFIKLIQSGVISTVRIVDGLVEPNT